MKIRKIKPIIRLYKKQMKEKYGVTITYAKWTKTQLKKMLWLLKPINDFYEDCHTVKVADILKGVKICEE